MDTTNYGRNNLLDRIIGVHTVIAEATYAASGLFLGRPGPTNIE